MSQQHNSIVRKRQREQEKQRRRLQIKSASRDHGSGSGGSAGGDPAPLFGPIQKKDSGNELQKFAKNVLGDYQTAIRTMEGNALKFLGTVETTPSTPVIPGKQNPFETSFQMGAMGTSSSATSSQNSGSRHPVAKLPASGGVSKKDKSRPHPKHAKAPKSVVSSKPHTSSSSAGTHESSGSVKKSAGSSGIHGSGENIGADVRPTNRLVVSGGSKRTTNRPFRPAPSPSHPGSAPPSKSKIAKPLAGSLAPTDLFKVDTRSERVVTHSHGSSSTNKFSKSKRAHGEPLSQGSTSLSDPQPHSSSTSSSASSGHKSSTSSVTSSSSSSPSTGTTAPSSAQPAHSHKLKKASTNPSISIPNSNKESLDTKISLPLRKTGSSDSVTVSSRPLPSPTLASRVPPALEDNAPAPTSIDIGQLHRMKLESASSDATPSGHLSSKKKKLKKKIKKSKDRPSSEEQSMDPLQVDTTIVKSETVKLEPQDNIPVSAVVSKPSTKESVSSLVTSVPGHMTTSEDHVITPWMSRMLEGSKLSKRPSSIKIGSGSGLGVQEVSMESGDVQNMLEEMMRPVPSLVTPIPTPKKDKSFAFPTRHPPLSGVTKAVHSRPSPPPKLKHPGKRPSRLLSNTSSEESDCENKEAVIAAVTTLDSNLAAESTPSLVPPAPRLEAPPTFSGSSSESSSSSDSSSSDSDSSSEEEEETITPMLEKLNKELPHSSSMVTPIKKTPPHVPSMLIPPIADDAANLSPPKLTSGTFPISTSSQAYSQPTSVYSHLTSVYSQSSSLPAVYSQATSAHSQPDLIFTSQCFPQMHTAATAESAFLGNNESVHIKVEESDSDSSSDSENDSGMETDSESSDSEEQSSEDEETQKDRNMTPQSGSLGALHRSEELVLFGQGGSSGGFWEDTDFMGGMGVTGPLSSRDVKSNEMTEASQRAQESFSFDTTTQPFDFAATQDHTEQRERYNSESGNSAQKKRSLESGRSSQKPKLAGVSQQLPQPGPTPQLDEKNSRKRKQQQWQHRQQQEEEIDRESAPESQPSPPKLPKIRIKIPPKPESPLLSPSVFSENESSSSSNSDEDELEGVTAIPPVLNRPATSEASAVRAGVQQQDDGEGREEVGGRLAREEGPNLMVVRIPLCLVDIPREPQKPKATVEPYHVTAPSKTTKRRTSEAAEREEAPHRRVSHSDYGRHRDDLDHNSEYGRDYRGREEERGRSHRDGRNWEGPPREHRLLSGSDELPPRAGRRHGRGERGTGEYRERGSSRETWERDREHYHHWSGYDHYDRRNEFDETVGRRPRYRTDNRGDRAEYYLQEAKKRKHDADKIRVSGVQKAKAYMESVVYFMRHGDALEHDHQAYRMYHDTISMVKCCQLMAGDLKSLVVLCLRCLSVLYWRMYLLKHTTVYQIQKELQDFFVLPKNTQKSPYPSSFSPLPSPASVGSTASASSTSSQDPSPSSAAISVPKHVFNKAAEHLNIATFVTQSCELWKHSDVLIEQCREFFSNMRRKAGRITQFSSVPEVADWVEFGLRSSRWP